MHETIVGLDYANIFLAQGNTYILLMKANRYVILNGLNTHAFQVIFISNVVLP